MEVGALGELLYKRASTGLLSDIGKTAKQTGGTVMSALGSAGINIARGINSLIGWKNGVDSLNDMEADVRDFWHTAGYGSKEEAYKRLDDPYVRGASKAIELGVPTAAASVFGPVAAGATVAAQRAGSRPDRSYLGTDSAGNHHFSVADPVYKAWDNATMLMPSTFLGNFIGEANAGIRDAAANHDVNGALDAGFNSAVGATAIGLANRFPRAAGLPLLGYMAWQSPKLVPEWSRDFRDQTKEYFSNPQYIVRSQPER